MKAIKSTGAFGLALAVTLLTSPAAADISIPNDPLQSAARVAPNILFILDDSGSMAFDAMPANSISSTYVTGRNYLVNTLYYNPAITYRPWRNADGSLMTGGTSYGAVYGSFNKVGGNTIDLADSASCRRYNKNNNATDDEMSSGGTEVCGGVQTFLVPKTASPSALDDPTQYYRYQILTDGSIIRSEWLARSGSSTTNYNNGLIGAGCPQSANGSATTTSGGAWRGCTRVLPAGTGRTTEADERDNYATWFSYHRTRMKAAKAGAGEAFNELNTDVRVGFRTIWKRNSTGTVPGNRPTESVPIPVNYNDGLFADLDPDPATPTRPRDNRTQWYRRLYDSIGQNGTPLHGALQGAGSYFANNASNGAWGPQAAADQYACRQNFAILTTDGFWNNDSNYTAVGEQDNANGANITSPTGEAYRYTPAAPYSASASGTLADVAMKYWKEDLRTDLPNVVPTTTKDNAFWQHMVTFGISIGLKGSLDPGTDWGGIRDGTTQWPDPWRKTDAGGSGWGEESNRRIDDLWHAAVNGRGEFIAATDPNEFAQGLRAALATITERTGSQSNLATTSSELNDGTQGYVASFISGVWTGQLRAFPSNAQGIDTSAAPLWSASAGIPDTGRTLITYNGAAGAVFPTAAQVTALARTNLPAVSGADNAAYIAGNRGLELANGGSLRNRNHLLGDVVNSSPAYDKETDTIYVGANDGMMHAFDSTNGQERFAYVPGGISLSDLATLSDPSYSHRFFVDGPITLSRRDQTPDETFLVGTLGRGGRGFYVLDVTDPDAFGTADVLWERTSTPLNNMGKILGQPLIGKMNDGSLAVIVPNGINSPNNRAALLIYELETGNLLAEIDTGEGSAATPNGLSAPTTRDIDGNGTVDYVYAGDLRGNMWKFDLRSATASNWASSTNRLKMFTAIDPNDATKRQPITAAPTVSRDPSTYELWVFFGTGRFMTNGDLIDTETQTVYALRDTTTTVSGRGALQERKFLVAGTYNGYNVRGFEPTGALPTDKAGWYLHLLDPPVPPGTAQGERIITPMQVIAGTLVFNSNIPSSDPCNPGGTSYLNALDAFTGTSRPTSFFDLNGNGSFGDESIDAGGGGGAGSTVAVGSFKINNMTMSSNILTAGGGSGNGGGGGGAGGVICLTKADGTVECKPIDDVRQVGRVAWRELIRE